MPDCAPVTAPFFLSGDGEMARRMREIDWSESPLGPPDTWPDMFKFALSLCLRSTMPTCIYWGPEMRLFYNDAWAPIPAERHPWALGRPAQEVWADIWSVVGPQMEDVLASGEGFAAIDQLLVMHRQGRRRATWWNYSFTPLCSPDGKVCGILNSGMEVTDRVQQERRQDFILNLSDALRGLVEPREVIRTAQRLLGEELGANRVGYGEVDASERWFTTADNWSNGVPSRHGTHDLAGFGPEIHANLRSGVPLIIEDVRSDPRTNAPAAIEAFEAIDTEAALTASLVKNGRMVAALYVHSRTPRAWSKSDVLLVQDVAERTWAEVARARAEAEARASEELYRRIFEQSSDMIVTAELDQVITGCNPAAAAAVGLRREEVIGRRTTDFILPEDHQHAADALQRKVNDGGTTRYDVRVRSAQGDLLYWEVNSGLTYDENGKPVGLHVVGRDVTDRKRWESHQRLLVGELNHRVKNTLAIVQSLSHQTFQAGRPPEQAIDAFEGRLQALAAAHNLLTGANWEAAAIEDIVLGALSPFCSDDRCTAEGPNVRVAPQTAVSLALAIHELATNAAKYGALGKSGGRVTINWSIEEECFRLLWEEEGGPPVAQPTRTGFGTRMLSRALARELGGTVSLDYRPAGVTCEIVAPVRSVVAPDG